MEYEEVEVNSERWFDLQLLLNEEFRDIEGYEGYYQASNYGRIKSLIQGERILSLKNNGNGYYQCVLHKSGKSKYFYVHNLVARTFLNKKDFKNMLYEDKNFVNSDMLEVNHKDENKANNIVDNLEWCTHSYNINYGDRNEKSSIKNINNIKTSRKIYQFDLNSNYIRTWDSMSEPKRQLGISKQSIYQCCIHKKKTAGGYIWKYVEEE